VAEGSVLTAYGGVVAYKSMSNLQKNLQRLQASSYGPGGGGGPGEPPGPINPNKVADKYLKKQGIDAHQLKKDYLGEKAPISQYDIYVDKADGRLWIFRKGGQGSGIPTSDYIK